MHGYLKRLPEQETVFIGENDLCLEIYHKREGVGCGDTGAKKPTLLFVHGAYTGSWMWCKYIPHFYEAGYRCLVMNLRSHYRSRVQDMTRITWQDYVADIREVIHWASGRLVLIGFSMGGLLSQKVAELETLEGLVVIDSSVSKEVNKAAPLPILMEGPIGDVFPAPIRNERTSADESETDIEFQRQYLSMESSLALGSMSCWVKGHEGISVDGDRIDCPALVLKAVNSEADDQRGHATAEQLKGKYVGFSGMTHTGMLVGQRYQEAVDVLLDWLLTSPCNWESRS